MAKITLKTGKEDQVGKVDKKMMVETACLGMFKKFFSEMFGTGKQMFRNNQMNYSPANFGGLGSRTFKMNQRKERKRSHCRKVKRL